MGGPFIYYNAHIVKVLEWKPKTLGEFSLEKNIEKLLKDTFFQTKGRCFWKNKTEDKKKKMK